MNQVPQIPFLEREELALLRNILLAKESRFSLILLQGEAGSGKTKLVQALASAMESEGWSVFPSRIGDSFASLAQLLSSLLDELARACKMTGRLEANENIDMAFRQAIIGLANRSPILIVLDGLDEILFDFVGEGQLLNLAQVVRNAPGSHLILTSRTKDTGVGQFTLEIEPDKVFLPGLSPESFQALIDQLRLPFREERVRFLYGQIRGLPKALELMADDPEEAFSRLERLRPTPDIDDIYRELYELRRDRIRVSMDTTARQIARAALGFLAILREVPQLCDLSDFLKTHIPGLAPEGPEDLWQFFCKTKLVKIFDLRLPIEPSRLTSVPLRLAHKSLKDFLHRDLSPEEKINLHQQLAKEFQSASSTMAQRNILYHLRVGWEGRPKDLADHLCQVAWNPLLASWKEGEGLILDDLGEAWRAFDSNEAKRSVVSVIEEALSDCLRHSKRAQRLKLLELAGRMAMPLPPGPFIYKLDEDVLTPRSDRPDRPVDIRQSELRSHLQRHAREWSLRVLVDTWPGYYPLFAVEKSLNREGIFLDILGSSKEKIDLLLDGNADLIATTPGCLLGTERDDIGKLRVLGVLNRSYGADKILVDSSKINLDSHGKPKDSLQIADAQLMATRSSTSHMFLNWFLTQYGLDPQSLFVQECSDYLTGMQETLDTGTIGVLSTWEPYATILKENNRDFRVVCASSDAPPLIIDLLVANRESAERLVDSRELKVLGELYFRALSEGTASQEEVKRRLCRRLGTRPITYGLGLKGVQYFNRAQMKRFFRNGAKELGEIFEAVARVWRKPYQVDREGRMLDNFRESLRHLLEVHPVWLWAEPVLKRYKYDIALSYSGKDKKYAEELRIFVTDAGFTVFDYQDEATKAKMGGKSLLDILEVYKEEARFCVIFCSRNYYAAGHTQDERDVMMERRRTKEGRDSILRIQIDKASLGSNLDDIIHWNISEGIPEIGKLIVEKLSGQ